MIEAKILTVHDGKGKKDRTVPLPEVLMPVLNPNLTSWNPPLSHHRQPHRFR
jgi:site-specific recombinase XerD